MTSEMMFVIAVIFAAISVPSMMNGYVDRTFPIVSSVIFVVAAGTALWIYSGDPETYAPRNVPYLFIQVAGDLRRAF